MVKSDFFNKKLKRVKVMKVRRVISFVCMLQIVKLTSSAKTDGSEKLATKVDEVPTLTVNHIICLFRSILSNFKEDCSGAKSPTTTITTTTTTTLPPNKDTITSIVTAPVGIRTTPTPKVTLPNSIPTLPNDRTPKTPKLSTTFFPWSTLSTNSEVRKVTVTPTFMPTTASTTLNGKIPTSTAQTTGFEIETTTSRRSTTTTSATGPTTPVISESPEFQTAPGSFVPTTSETRSTTASATEPVVPDMTTSYGIESTFVPTSSAASSTDTLNNLSDTLDSNFSSNDASSDVSTVEPNDSSGTTREEESTGYTKTFDKASTAKTSKKPFIDFGIFT